MKIAFIQFLHMEYIGIMYLSAVLKKDGHAVEVFICPGSRGTDAFVEDIVNYRPDVVGFSIMTGSEDAAVALAQNIKKRVPAYVVFGGPHPTVVPDIIGNDGVDCVCIGEAEQSLATIVATLAAGKLPQRIPGAWCKVDGDIVRNDIGPLVQDLGTLPPADRSLYREKYPSLRGKRAGFIAGRGCPFQCTFCANHALLNLYKGKGAFVRQRSVADVIDEIQSAVRTYGITRIFFEDDTFIMNRAWVLSFCEVYKREIGLPFSCHIRADLATEELISALADARCRIVSFGVETGDMARRRQLLKKLITDDQIVACAGLLKKHGIRFRTLNILGLPGETLENALQTVAINVRIKADYPWCSLYQPLPGTEMREYSVEKGLFNAETARLQASFFKDSQLVLQSKREIINLQKLFIYAVKLPFLLGIIRRAIRVRPNIGYELLFILAHAWVYLRSSILPFRDLISFGFMNIGRYLPRGKRRRLKQVSKA